MNAVATPESTRPLVGRLVAPGEGEILEAYGDRVRIVLSSDETGDALCIVDVETPAGNGPPHHVHHNETEIFRVVSGRYEFIVDGRRSEVGPGTIVYGPPHVPHQFRALTEGGKLQVTCVPGGFDRFFTESAQAFAAGPPSPEELLDLGAKYGIEFLPPVTP